MKKLLLVLTIAAFVACNDSGNTEETPKADSPATPATETPVTPPAGDTTHTGDTAKHGDTTSVKK